MEIVLKGFPKFFITDFRRCFFLAVDKFEIIGNPSRTPGPTLFKPAYAKTLDLAKQGKNLILDPTAQIGS